MFQTGSELEIVGFTPANSGLTTVALLFGIALARALVCALSDRPSRTSHRLALAGVVAVLVSIGMLYLQRDPTFADISTGAVGLVLFGAALALRAGGLVALIWGFGRAAAIGGRAAWIDWVLAMVFAIGLLVFVALLYQLGGRVMTDG